MKPVYCSEIVSGELEDLGAAPQGLCLDGMGISGRCLVARSQRQSGIRRNVVDAPCFAAVKQERWLRSLISAEGCVREATVM